jgi:hypothetical protein
LEFTERYLPILAGIIIYSIDKATGKHVYEFDGFQLPYLYSVHYRESYCNIVVVNHVFRMMKINLYITFGNTVYGLYIIYIFIESN